MSLWLAAPVATAAGAGFAFWIYRRRELRVPGRAWLAVARGMGVALVLILLADPAIPGNAAGVGDRERWVLLDATLSMSAGPEGARPWDAAVARASQLEAEGARVLLFGAGLRTVGESGLDGDTPLSPSTRLAPALARVAEAGARSVVVLSDFRVWDAPDVVDVLGRVGLELELEHFGVTIRNAGIAELQYPRSVTSGDSIALVVAVFGESSSSNDSADVEIRDGDRLVANGRVPIPRPGTLARLELTIPAPANRATVRYEARVTLAGDDFAADDHRAGYVIVDPEEGGVVLVALTPAWESRFLLPVLERVTGLPGLGFLRLADGRFLPMGQGEDVGSPVGADALLRRARAADLLVLLGVGAEHGDWLRIATEETPRAVLAPRDRGAARALGLQTGNALEGEWFVSPALPASPLTAELAGAEFASLPPLTRVLPLARGENAPVPMRLQLQGRGPGEAALVLRESNDRRLAILLASGFWRWAFRAGAPHDTYQRLWSGIGGWLLQNETVVGGPGTRPVDRVNPRGEPLEWVAPGRAGQALDLTVLGSGDSLAAFSITVGASGGFRTPALPPGAYTYTAADGDGEALGGGTFEVEEYSGELQVRPIDLEDSDGAGKGIVRHAGPVRPLRTHPLPYLFLIGLLCAEWIGRRRRGLR